MNNLIDRLSRMNAEEMDAVIEADMAGDGEVAFELEGLLLGVVRERVFPDSETFGDLDDETDAERCIRVLIESLGIPESLSAILALDDEAEENDQ